MNYEAESEVIFQGKKEYEQEFIVGQLVGWHQQTIYKPNASVVSQRKGLLGYPDVSNFCAV